MRWGENRGERSGVGRIGIGGGGGGSGGVVLSPDSQLPASQHYYSLYLLAGSCPSSSNSGLLAHP